jgi:hypothetical protein
MKNQDASTWMKHSHRTNLFKSENQTMTFSHTRFPVNKINVEKKIKMMRKLLFNFFLSIHILKFENFMVWQLLHGAASLLDDDEWTKMN